MPSGGRSWTADEEKQLLDLLERGSDRHVIAKDLNRKVAAIEGRLNILRKRHSQAKPGFQRSVFGK